MVSASPLPPVPERHRLVALMELDADLPATAARTRTPLDELMQWASTEPVQAWLAAHTRFAETARTLREFKRAAKTLDDLEQLAAATTNPIEKRLTLTAILRASFSIINCSPTRERRTASTQRDTRERQPEPAPSQPAPGAERPPKPAAPPQRPSGQSASPDPAAPSDPQTGLISSVPFVPSTPSLPLLLAPIALDLPGPRHKRTHTPAHLIAAAGLPAP
jgi:hypothetical protein